MNTKPIAVFDIDDTLADLAWPFAQHLFNKYRDRIFLEDLRVPNVRELAFNRYPELDTMKELRELEASGAFKTLPLIDRTFDIYRRLQDSGHEMHLLTARGWMIDGEGETREWMKFHDITADKLSVISLEDCKSLHFPERAAFYYDDHHGHVTRCASRCEKAFLVNQAWNQHLVLPKGIETV